MGDAPQPTGEVPQPTLKAPLLFISVLLIASCGLIYELVAGTLSSYLLGDSVTQFSTVIGVYLSAMGLGSWLSKFLQRGLARRFVDLELAVALVGGFSAPILFQAFAHTHAFRVVLYGVVMAVGTLVGLEIPILMRILKDQVRFKDLVAGVLTLDYIGALFASLLFPLLLMPKLGLVRTSLLFGLLNAAVGLWSTHLLQSQLGPTRMIRLRCAVVMALLAVGLVFAGKFTLAMEEEIFADEIVYAKDSAYQRIVLTRGRGSFQLFLNGNLQFSSADEYRYHEALVHPAFGARPEAKRILICGGGDGLAVREVLKHPSVQEVVLVDLDPAMTDMARNQVMVRQLNGAALDDPRVKVVNADAMVWLQETPGAPFDLAFVDFPDPNTYALGKLYTSRFYRILQRRLTEDALVAVQSTSPLMARQSFWCIAATMEASGLKVRPYHLAVPSFGVWGFALASKRDFEVPTRVLPGLRHLSDEATAAMFTFPRDMDRVPVEVNRLDNQVLVHLYTREWRRWS
ncbi:polyamine aminopropyltransferase 1 [Geothrix oryzae]|uniref:Polyamine aminopropyltransferase n=1 Tax=Geothrix oryzae TaxID=2927975 RepID=A0ABM8DS04_9BACT|nr:polyamine aminopropyltransferase [Geothrix oryzae]BDU69812.1 polyamine aminopropyltransferase 1 [Geothrix oryzae]